MKKHILSSTSTLPLAKLFVQHTRVQSSRNLLYKVVYLLMDAEVRFVDNPEAKSEILETFNLIQENQNFDPIIHGCALVRFDHFEETTIHKILCQDPKVIMKQGERDRYKNRYDHFGPSSSIPLEHSDFRAVEAGCWFCRKKPS